MATLKNDIVIAVYDWHSSAERAVVALHDAGYNMKRISMVIRNGAFWGQLYGLMGNSAPEYIPVHGATLVLGNFIAEKVRGVRDVIVLGNCTALTDAMSLLGLPARPASLCETALKANDFILVAHSDERDVYRICELLETSGFTTLAHFPAGYVDERSLPRNPVSGGDTGRGPGAHTQPAT